MLLSMSVDTFQGVVGTGKIEPPAYGRLLDDATLYDMAPEGETSPRV